MKIIRPPLKAETSPLQPPILAKQVQPERFLLENFIKLITDVNESINITCINPENDHVTSTSFIESTDCVRYTNDMSTEKYNIYFTVNKLKHTTVNKPKKSDIKFVTFSHVDIDPMSGDIEQLRQALRAKIPGLICKYQPTFTIWSGNGIQLFWKHSAPLSIEAGEAINKHLIDLFHGDKGTHNADRLMRVPFTRNYPTATKIAKGYSPDPVLAELIQIDPEIVYAPSLFPASVNTPALVLQAMTSTKSSLIKGSPGQLHKAYQSKISNNEQLALFASYQRVPDAGHSEIFQSLLNHAAFYAQGNSNLVLCWIKESGLGQSDWFLKRLARPDGIVMKEIKKAIESQHNFYDPNYLPSSSTGDLSHADLALELGNRYFFKNVRYVGNQGTWFIWDGSRWNHDETLKHLSIIGDYLSDRAKELLTWAESQTKSSSTGKPL